MSPRQRSAHSHVDAALNKLDIDCDAQQQATTNSTTSSFMRRLARSKKQLVSYRDNEDDDDDDIAIWRVAATPNGDGTFLLEVTGASTKSEITDATSAADALSMAADDFLISHGAVIIDYDSASVPTKITLAARQRQWSATTPRQQLRSVSSTPRKDIRYAALCTSPVRTV